MPSRRRGSVEGLAGDPLAADPHATGGPSEIDAAEHGSPFANLTGVYGRRADMADAQNPGTVVTLQARDGVDPRTPRGARQHRPAHRPFRRRTADPGYQLRAALQKVVGEREVSFVIESTGHGETPSTYTRCAHDAVGVRYRPARNPAKAGPWWNRRSAYASMIWMRLWYGYAAPDASVRSRLSRSVWSTRLRRGHERRRNLAKCADLRGERARAVAGVASREVGFNNDRLGLCRSRGPYAVRATTSAAAVLMTPRSRGACRYRR